MFLMNPSKLCLLFRLASISEALQYTPDFVAESKIFDFRLAWQRLHTTPHQLLAPRRHTQ
jgi:hypothetical protein